MLQCTQGKMKRQSTTRENIFSNDTSDKGYYPKCMRNSFNLTPKTKTNSRLKNWQWTWIDISPKKTCRWLLDI